MNKFIAFLLMSVWAFTAKSDEMPAQRPTLSRALLRNTVRIETLKNDGTWHVGTGFFYVFSLKVGTNSVAVPALVTCWHVVSDTALGQMHFALASSNGFSRVQDDLTVDLPPNMWIRHPDTNVDLAILPVAPIMNQLNSKGEFLDFLPVNESLIPDLKTLEDEGVFQEVKFIGYPIGLWDQKNNLPVVRRGMTATDPTVDYNGRSEFLIDAAVFPGSSGSPVFTVSEGGGFRNGSLFMGGSHIELLGVIYAFPKYTSEGTVEIRTIPTAFDAKAMTDIPPNLGLVIKASRLKDFKSVIQGIIESYHLTNAPTAVP